MTDSRSRKPPVQPTGGASLVRREAESKAPAPAAATVPPPAPMPAAKKTAPARDVLVPEVQAAEAPVHDVPVRNDPAGEAIFPEPIPPVADKGTAISDEGLVAMATAATAATDTAKPAAEKAQAMFNDVNERAKTAFEKSAKIGEEFTDFAKGNVEALVASGRVAAKGAETLSQEAAEYGRKSLEQATAAFKSFAAVKSPTELFQLQSDYARTSFDSAVAEASRFSETFVKIAGEIFQPLSTRYAVAAEKIRSVAL